MNNNVDVYFARRAAYEAAQREFFSYRQGLQDQGMSLSEADDSEGSMRRKEECRRLAREADELAFHVIRANLANLEMEDMTNVTGVLYQLGGIEVGRTELLSLSELCGVRIGALMERFCVEMKDICLRIGVEKDGKTIGYIDDDAVFHYEKAPNLREALGWAIATDGGRVRIIPFFHLEKAAKLVLDTIRTHGVGREAFFDEFLGALKRIIVYRSTSRFTEGFWGGATTLWRVATRELGMEHKGYPYGC